MKDNKYTMAKTFKDFQRRNHCSQLHPDDMEKWLWEMIGKSTDLKAENAELKAALTNIQAVAVNNLDHDMHRVYKMCDEVLEATK